jgi:hypothetical protein
MPSILRIRKRPSHEKDLEDPGRHWIWGYLGGNIEGALKTVDFEKILSSMYLGRTFLEIYN